MQSSLTDLFEVIGLMAVPTVILLVCRFLNRRWDRAAAMNNADDAVDAPYRQGG